MSFLKKTIFLLYILLLRTLCADITDIRANIPENDINEIKSLFKNFFLSEPFAYTLFDVKPLSLTTYLTTPYNYHDSYNDWDLKIGQWNIWKKYKHLFAMNDFLLIEDVFPKHQNFKFILFINKKEFIKISNKYKSLFKWESPETILTNLKSGKITFFEAIRNNEQLLGILLGFGPRNSALFLKREHLFKIGKKEEIDHLYKILEGVGECPSYPFLITPVCFVGDPQDPETQNLAKKYSDAWKKISREYQENDFFEITLQKLLN